MVRRDSSGVTLVELAVVLVLLAIVAGLTLQAAGLLQGRLAQGGRRAPPTTSPKRFDTRDSAPLPMPKTIAWPSASQAGVLANTKSIRSAHRYILLWHQC